MRHDLIRGNHEYFSSQTNVRRNMIKFVLISLIQNKPKYREFCTKHNELCMGSLKASMWVACSSGAGVLFLGTLFMSSINT